jgi:hypothetical protein
MPCAAVDIFRRAAGLNRDDERRQGNVIVIDSPRRIVFSGDIHGYRSAFSKIVSHARLTGDPNCIIVLQEILHAEPDANGGQDRSIELLMRAARLKNEHPEQVLFVMGNHDLAQVSGSEISKYGHGVCKAFVEGVKFAFPDDAGEVIEALDDFFASLPLAIRCPNGVLISHSVPSPGKFVDACADKACRQLIHSGRCDTRRRDADAGTGEGNACWNVAAGGGAAGNYLGDEYVAPVCVWLLGIADSPAIVVTRCTVIVS